MPRPFSSGVLGIPLALALFAAGCGDDDPSPVVPPVPDPPGPVAPSAVLSVQATARADTVFVSWVGAAGATSFRAELSGPVSHAKTTTGLSAFFTSADGLKDHAAYTATVVAVGPGGETPGARASVTTNFFPWDEYYATGLHNTGQGMATFYDARKGGFEAQSGVPYQDLACKTCHLPQYTGGCRSCHGIDNPQLGAQVDATLTGVCGTCHSRQKAEAASYSDVHRAAGMDCMACHTLGDVHGDGTVYASMLEPGAIDPKCQDCHAQVENHLFHSAHSETVDCAVCHAQSVISCYNCHFETEVQAKKKIAYGQMKGWNFLINRDGKVHLANFQSVMWGGETMVGFGPFYAHTISRNAVKACDDCHGAPSVNRWFQDGKIDVVTWDAAQGKLVNRKGFIPVPPNFEQGGLIFDFVNLDRVGGSVWSYLERGPDRVQLLYGTPLTQAQMQKLR